MRLGSFPSLSRFLTLPTKDSNPGSLEDPPQLGKKTQLTHSEGKTTTIHQDGKSNPRKLNSGSNSIQLVQKLGRHVSSD